MNSRLLSLSLIFIVNFVNQVNSLSNSDTILQFYEWKYSAIAQECDDWLSGKKYAAIQVSPLTKTPDIPTLPWYERYQPMMLIMDTLSGNSTQFVDMVKRCNNHKVKVFVDISYNSQADPVIGLGLLDLPDSVEETQFLENTNIYHYLNYLTSVGVAGFNVKCNNPVEIDVLGRIFKTILSLNPNFGFEEESRATVLVDTTNELVREKLNDHDVLTAVYEHGYARRLARVFVGTDRLQGLKNLSKKLESSVLSTPLVYVDHRDNHLSDNVHLSSQSSKLYKMAMAFSLAYPYGIPKVMSSYDFKQFPNGPPTNAAGEQVSPQFDTMETCDNGYMCEQRWRQIANMVEFRKIVGDEPIANWWDNNKNQVVFSRGGKGFIAINMEGHDLEDAFQTGLPKGTYCDVITGVNYGMCTGLTVKVDANGFALILLPAISRDGVLAIHIGNSSFIENDIYGMN